MPRTVTQRFMQALQQAESRQDPAPILALYAEDATSQNLTPHVHKGLYGAREFWQRYLDDFQEIRSEFVHQTDDDTSGVMEWTSRGRLKNGRPIEYRGVSVIEVTGDKVKKFRTYYDSAAFVLEAE